MPFTTNTNVTPFYNDFDESKNYHQILFRPSVAVQARELTQLQSILQNQIERFGNWAFKNGDIVEGCSIVDLPVVPFVFLSDTDAANNGYDTREYVNCVVVSATSNLQARVLAANVGFQANYPNSNILYLTYLNTGNTGAQVFSNNELLYVYTANTSGRTLIANVYTMSNAISTNTVGTAHGISVSEGVVFLNGAFVKVQSPTFGLVNNYGSYAGNNVVGFQGLESIITENQDSSLNDNALGYSNYNAPGAYRLKVVPTLVSLAESVASNTEGFNPIASYNYGVIVAKSVEGDVYSVVSDALAKRTYEESGNYVVNPFSVDTVTSSGDPVVAPSNSSYLLAKVSPGVGYSQGARVSLEKPAYINMRRGTDTDTSESQIITFNYGGYFQLREVAGSFDFNKAQTIQLYDAYQTAVTDREFSSLSPVGNNIGTAMTRCYSYSGGGAPGTNTAIYLLHVFNIQLNSGSNINQVKSVYYSSGSTKGVGDLDISGIVSSGTKEQLYSFGIPGVKNLRTANGTGRNTEYVYRTKTTGTLNANGTLVITVTNPNQQLPYGLGVVPDSVSRNILVIPSANSSSAALTGNVAVYNTSVNVNGNGTLFTTNFVVGDIINVGSDYRTVTGISNSTAMTVDSPFSANASGQTYYQHYPAGKQLNVSLNLPGSPGYINVTNSTSFTFVTQKSLAGAISVNVTYDVKKITTNPSTKVIKKNRFVKIDTTSNKTGPWCLGFSDVHRVRGVYAGSSNSSYSTSNPDVTNLFAWNSGQRDTHYDLGYLYAKSVGSTTTNPYLLVELDYFAPNTTPGVGFFTVESYPIDDANTANTNAIQTYDIPLYVDESGRKISLRDYVDFRPVSVITANDTGIVDRSNTSQVTTAISYATLNPSSTVAFSATPADGYDVPSYGQNLETDFTYYLPRKDIVYVTPSNMIKTKGGAPNLTPQSPLYPDNGMVLGEIFVPPYPSLTSDQINLLTPINQSSQVLCRDTSQRTLITLLANRRYTMRDIGIIDKRVTNLEYYTQLSLLEKAAKDMTVTDINGLDRFKNGIFVEPFSDFGLSMVSNPEFNIAIDSQKGVARPRMVREVIRLNFNSGSSSGVQKTGRCITLPYTEVSFIRQPYATKYRSASHVAYAWNGTMTLFPSYNNHTDLNQVGAVNMTVDNARPWQDFASSPFGYTWGDWRTTTNTAVSTAVTGSVQTYNLNINYGYRSDAPPAISEGQLYEILTFNGITPSSDYVIGNVSAQYLGTGAGAAAAMPSDALKISGVNYNNNGGGGADAFLQAVAIGWIAGWW